MTAFPWHAFAACRGVDPRVFFPGRTDDTNVPKSICATCVVRKACLNFAMAGHIQHGIWGGTSERQRRQLRKSWKPPPKPPPTIDHGTIAGYRAELRQRVPTCLPCRVANNYYRQVHRQPPPARKSA